MRILRAGCVVFAAAAACGGDGGGGPADPVSTEEATSTCEDFAAHAAQCGWGGNVNEFDWNCGEAALVWRADAFRAFAGCAIALACDGVGASCYTETVDEVTPVQVHQDYAARCAERLPECGLPTSPLCDPDRYELYTAAAVQPLIACFDQACDAILGCLESAL